VPANRRAEALALAGRLLGAHAQVHKVYDAAQVAAHMADPLFAAWYRKRYG